MEEGKSLPSKKPKEKTWEHLLKQEVDDSKDQKWANIPKVEGNWPEKIWSMIEEAKQGSQTFDSALLEEIHVDWNPHDFDKNNICGYIGFI